jgi:hypothetical protein
VWVRRRQLWAWEEKESRECQALLHDFVLQAQSPDLWLWRPDSDRGYSVWGAYQLPTSHPSDSLDAAADLIWHKHVPLKVYIYAGRLLRDWLPTKTNFAIRGIIAPEVQSCTCGRMRRYEVS